MFKKIISITLCTILLLCMTVPVFASTGETDEPETSTCAAITPIFKEDDVFGYWGWSSVEDAMNKYGNDFTYNSCTPFKYNSHIYNHYYTFSNGSRMYFGVIAK